VNEILTHTDAPALDAIELFNPNGSDVNIGDWFLSDDPGHARKYQIPVGTIIAAGGYKVFTENDFNKDPLATNSFALSSSGDEIYLFSADSAGNLTGFSDGFDYAAGANGVTFGRYVTSDGKIHHPAQKLATLGSANAGPSVGPIVINEIRYAPGTNEVEFVELKNITAQPVNLFDPDHPTNTWRINGLDFSFPTNVTLAANGLLVIAQTDPARFRASNNVPTSAQIFGPYFGELQDNGENLQILRPDAPKLETDGSTTVPMIVVDEVRYNNNAPWPTNAIGAGVSLERIYASQYGDDPINWRAALAGPSPGLDNNGNRPPVIQPGADQSLIATRFPFNVSISATVVDDGQPADPGKLTLHWAQVSGPYPATFSNASAASTTVAIPAVGTYVFSLSASDGLLQTSANLTVNLARPPVNDLVAFGSTWSYFDGGLDLGGAWTSVDFDASGWATGNGQFGYGDGDEVTIVGYGGDPNTKYITTYFRRNFNVKDAKAFSSLALKYVRDDGMVVYINGNEVFRDANMPAGPIAYNTPALTAISGTDESLINEAQLDPAVLVNGSNLIAVEIHQSGATSSDISFDLQLTATAGGANQAPVVDAGPDLQIGAGDWLTINGSVSDDGLPVSPGIPTVSWVAETNPGSVTFSSKTTANTAVNFDAGGIYTLALSASDGTFSSTDRMVVTVTAADAWVTWRNQMFTPAELADPSISGSGADPDGDGMTNREEFICGTDPKSAASALRLSFTLDAGPALQFQGKAGRAYILYFRAAFDGAAWGEVGNYPAEANDRVIQVSNPQPGFYRLAVPQ